MPNKGTSKHLNSVQYFTLFVQSESQMYLRDLTRDCACIAVRHNRVAERSWFHCSCENGVPWIHFPIFPWKIGLPSFFPWKLPQRHPRSAMSITCFLTCQRRVPLAEIYIYLQMLHMYTYNIYIHIYIYQHACLFPKKNWRRFLTIHYVGVLS